MPSDLTWQRYEQLLLGGLVLVALSLRVLFLDRVPPGVRFDELVNVKMADHIYAGEWPIYFQEAWGHEPLYHYVHAAGMSLLGKNVLGVRITSILFGVAGTLAAYLVFRHLFGPGVALLAAALLATSFWSLMYSRIGLRHISLPPWIGLAAYAFWRGIETPAEQGQRGTSWFALGGVCVGLMLYTYFASRVVPVIFAAFVLYLVLFHRSRLRGRWIGLLLFFLLPALMVTPLVLYLHQHPELEQRLGQVGGELLAALRASDVVAVTRTILDTLKMFSLVGDPEWLYNISGRPVFDPASAILFYLGVAVSLSRWRDPRRAFILIWLVVGIAPAMLSWPPGSLGHAIAAQPVAFVFPALGMASLWEWATRGEQPPIPGAHRLRRGAPALAIAAVLLFACLNGYDYFVRWPRFPQVRHEYQAPVTAVARYLEEHDEVESASVSAPYVDYWNPWSKMNFDLQAPDKSSRVRWFNGATSILFPAGTGSLFFLPDDALSPSGINPDLYALLQAGSQVLANGYTDRSGGVFDLYRWTDAQPLQQRLASASSAPAWTGPEGPYVKGESEKQRQQQGLPLDFGHRLAFLAYAYDRTEARGGETWRITTYWRVLDADSAPLAIFVHVLDDANQVRAGWDGLYVSPESWQEGDILVHLHTLDLPPDMPAGTQRVELGVYSPVTLERLVLFPGDGGEPVPYNRVLLSPLTVR
jgi:4-amino-4-deoxy-L-arabinose transferase-like glycosyltransferase